MKWKSLLLCLAMFVGAAGFVVVNAGCNSTTEEAEHGHNEEGEEHADHDGAGHDGEGHDHADAGHDADGHDHDG